MDLLSLLVLLAGSLVMPLISGQIRVPSAVLLILYGIAVGPHALGAVHDSAVIEFLYELGFIVLMFLAGMEIDFNRIRQRGRQGLLVIVIVCLTVFLLAFVMAFLMGLHTIYGLVLGAMSVGLPLAVLKESGHLRSATGQMVILVGSVGEFLTVVGLTIFYFFSRYGFSLGLLWGLARLAAMLALSGLSLRTLVALAWWHPYRFSRIVAQDDASEIGVRTTLVLMLAFSLLAILAGLESIVGAFVAGALIAFVLRGKDVLEEKLAVVGHGLFIPIFFMIVGLRFEPAAVTLSNLMLAGEMVLATLVIRTLPCLLLLTQGLQHKGTLAVASLLSAPLTLVIAIASVGQELGVVDLPARGTLVVLALLAGILFPVLYRVLDRPPSQINRGPDG
jgi:Kef-type K+ transport system membrane component KefB